MSVREQLPPLIITFLVVDVIAVGLRVWIRVRIKRSFGYDDMALCTALVRLWNTTQYVAGPHMLTCHITGRLHPSHRLIFHLPQLWIRRNRDAAGI